MSDDASVEGVKQSLAMAIEELGRAQGSLAAAQDRIDATREIVHRVMDESGKTESTIVKAGLVDMKADIDQAVATSVLVKDNIDLFLAGL